MQYTQTILLEAVPRQKQIFSIIENILSENEFPTEHLKLKQNASYWSIYYYDTFLICSFKFSKTANYISFDCRHKKLFDSEKFKITQIKSEPNRFRVHFEKANDIMNLSNQIVMILKNINIPSTFDICSRYQQCSDQKRCVHPNKAHAKECSYKKKLDKGIIFYGQNRNIN